MVSVCLYFKIHQPYRLKKYQAKDIDSCHGYQDEEADKEMMDRLADKCYLPANEILYQQIIKHNGKFRISFSISGIAMELLHRYRPDVISSFKKLASTGCLEFLAETYYHSLSSLYSAHEFQRQVLKHVGLIKNLFDLEPVVFKNTEFIHNNRIARLIAGTGMKGILCEGVERILKGRSSNQIYSLPDMDHPLLLLRNATLSDDIAFRFGDPNWSEHPLAADKFADWLNKHPENTKVINLFIDYSTFGIHKPKDTGIFNFLEALPASVLLYDVLVFSTPSAVLNQQVPTEVYDVSKTISWEDRSTTHCAWCENVMQNNTLKKIYSIEKLVMQSTDKKAADTWGQLQSADYFYYMADDLRKEDANKYFNPHTAREVFQYYTNLVTDFEISLIKKAIEQKRKNSSSQRIPFNILNN